jgi:hypothetical protein
MAPNVNDATEQKANRADYGTPDGAPRGSPDILGSANWPEL